MTNLHATIRHHSIASARVVDLGTADMAEAKKLAAAEFRGEFADYRICILGERSVHNPDGIVATRRVGARKWMDVA
jgi:hypothetical protein